MALDDSQEQELRTQLHEAEKQLQSLQAGLPKEKLKNSVNPDLARTVAELKEEIAEIKDTLKGGSSVTILGGSGNGQDGSGNSQSADSSEAGASGSAQGDEVAPNPNQFNLFDY